jgi:hypothetical protein
MTARYGMIAIGVEKRFGTDWAELSTKVVWAEIENGHSDVMAEYNSEGRGGQDKVERRDGEGR